MSEKIIEIMNTNTQILEKISSKLAEKLNNLHSQCIKEVEIALMQEQLKCLPEIQKDIREIKETIIIVKNDKRWAMAIVGFIGSLIGIAIEGFFRR